MSAEHYLGLRDRLQLWRNTLATVAKLGYAFLWQVLMAIIKTIIKIKTIIMSISTTIILIIIIIIIAILQHCHLIPIPSQEAVIDLGGANLSPEANQAGASLLPYFNE